MNRFLIIEHRGIKDLGFNKILEYMASIGQFGIVSGSRLFGLAYNFKSAYVGK